MTDLPILPYNGYRQPPADAKICIGHTTRCRCIDGGGQPHYHRCGRVADQDKDYCWQHSRANWHPHYKGNPA